MEAMVPAGQAWPPGDGPDVVGNHARLEQGDEHAE